MQCREKCPHQYGEIAGRVLATMLLTLLPVATSQPIIKRTVIAKGLLQSHFFRLGLEASLTDEKEENIVNQLVTY